MNPILAYGCLALSMTLVGSYVALSKPLLAVFPVLLLAWLRFGLGGLAMLAWLKKPADELPLTRRTQGLLFAESLLGNFLFSICMLYGMKLSGAVAAGVILAAIPAAVAVMSWVFLKERISGRLWLATALAVAGIALVSLSKQELQWQVLLGPQADLMPKSKGQTSWLDDAFLGNALLVGAMLCEAAYAVIGKRLTGRLGAKRIAALINAWGFALATPLGLWLALSFDFSRVGAGTWTLLLFYALAASVLTVWLWMTGLKVVAASRAGVFTVMLPISAAAVGVGVLGEVMSALQMAAFGLALVGVVLATWPEKELPD